jgi:hypothetical protein
MHSSDTSDMKSIRIIHTLLILSFSCPALFAQEMDGIPMVRYSPGYAFKDGIFLSIEDVMVNDPLPFARIVSERVIYDRAFIEELIWHKEFTFYDEAGVRASVRTRDVWGYALHGRLHIMIGGRFHRIHLQGSISQFVASETTYEKKYFADDDSIKSYTTTQDLYRGFYSNKHYYSPLTAEGEICLFDFESNALEQYDPAALGKLLERDSLLYSEYKVLKRRVKKNRMAEFIRRYNQNHPLFFPEN